METEFEELEVENFGPFVGKHKLRLANGGSLNFVKGRNDVEPRLGSNGAGKSKLLNAISWCLYGKTTDDLGSTDIRPWSGKGKTIVTLKLTSWDGDEGERHIIVRTAGPNSLTVDSKPCSQDAVDKLIGMSHGVFCLAPFLGQGLPLFHDLPNSKKLEFLGGVLGLDRWDEHSERAKRKADELDRKLQRVIGEISGSRVRAEELSSQVKRQKETADAWDEERAAKLAEAQAATKRLAKTAEAARTTHAKVEVKLDSQQLVLKQDTADVRKITEAAHKAELQLRSVQSREAQVVQEYERAKAELANLKEKRMCPTCGQNIKRESRYLENVEAAELRIRSYSKELNTTALQDATKAATAAKKKVADYNKRLDELRAAVEKLEDEERTLRREAERLEMELLHAKKVCDQFVDDVNPHRARLAELRRAHKQALTNTVELEKERDALEVKVQQTRYWVKGFKDVRLHVLEDVLEELEFVTNTMLDAIGLVGWEVRYDIERETKSGTLQRGLITTVLSPQQNADVKWKSWSGGEGQRLRIAGSLALSEVVLARVGVVCNIEVLDEPTRHLSSEGVDDLCEFLADRARTLKKSIYLVDHMAIESTRFDRVITVRKTDAGSSISGG